MNWLPIDIQYKNSIDAFLKAHEIPLSDYNFTHLFLWQKSFAIEFAIEEDTLFIRGKDPTDQKRYCLMPLGETAIRPAFEQLNHVFERESEPFLMRGVTTEMYESLPEHLKRQHHFELNRDEFEYVYPIAQFEAYDQKILRDKRYMSHLFARQHTYEFKQYHSNDRNRVLKLINRWESDKTIDEDNLLYFEKEGIIKLLEYFDALNCEGYMLIVEDEVVGFVIVEGISEDTLLVHYEKALKDFKGAYEVIKQGLSTVYKQSYIYFNYEEDMGIEGLRLSKNLYRPCRLEQKGIILRKCKEKR